MPKISVRKSIVIKVPREQVFAKVRDFRQWPVWSPWLITEPDCQVTYTDDGKQYAWDGKVVGAGEMAIVNETTPQSIDYLLTFLKPWKSKANVRFDFVEKKGGTEATWIMDSSLPFILFFLRPMMTAMIGMDYKRGLAMLKDYLETGVVPSALEFLGEHEVPGCQYVGIQRDCDLGEIGQNMHSDFAKLTEAPFVASGKPFAIYHKWDLAKGRTNYTAAVPIGGIPEGLTAEMITGERPACRTYAVKHTGFCRHLGNAWSAGMFRARNRVFQQHKQIAPFEVYDSSPEDCDSETAVATVHFPVK